MPLTQSKIYIFIMIYCALVTTLSSVSCVPEGRKIDILEWFESFFRIISQNDHLNNRRKTWKAQMRKAALADLSYLLEV
jgi:hypothetical protein